MTSDSVLKTAMLNEALDLISNAARSNQTGMRSLHDDMVGRAWKLGLADRHGAIVRLIQVADELAQSEFRAAGNHADVATGRRMGKSVFKPAGRASDQRF